MRVFWAEIKYLKCAARLRVCVVWLYSFYYSDFRCLELFSVILIVLSSHWQLIFRIFVNSLNYCFVFSGFSIWKKKIWMSDFNFQFDYQLSIAIHSKMWLECNKLSNSIPLVLGMSRVKCNFLTTTCLLLNQL